MAEPHERSDNCNKYVWAKNMLNPSKRLKLDDKGVLQTVEKKTIGNISQAQKITL